MVDEEKYEKRKLELIGINFLNKNHLDYLKIIFEKEIRLHSKKTELFNTKKTYPELTYDDLIKWLLFRNEQLQLKLEHSNIEQEKEVAEQEKIWRQEEPLSLRTINWIKTNPETDEAKEWKLKHPEIK